MKKTIVAILFLLGALTANAQYDRDVFFRQEKFRKIH